MAQTMSPSFIRATEDAYGVPRGLIAKDPEAAAIIATTPCPECGLMHGVKPCEPLKIGRLATIPVNPS